MTLLVNIRINDVKHSVLFSIFNFTVVRIFILKNNKVLYFFIFSIILYLKIENIFYLFFFTYTGKNIVDLIFLLEIIIQLPELKFTRNRKNQNRFVRLQIIRLQELGPSVCTCNAQIWVTLASWTRRYGNTYFNQTWSGPHAMFYCGIVLRGTLTRMRACTLTPRYKARYSSAIA